MATTVQEIYDRFCYDLLEDDGLILGIVTDAQFLNYLQEAVVEFCQMFAMVKKISTQQIILGTAQYAVSEQLASAELCFVGGIHIDDATMEELGNSSYGWANEVGQPTSWFQDGLPADVIQVVPIPDYTGTAISSPEAVPPFGEYGTFNPTARNLTMVGPSLPETLALTLDDDIPDEVPDSFTPYLLYRVHAKVASMDGEAKDLQRAYYCNARWQEGVALAKAIVQEALT